MIERLRQVIVSAGLEALNDVSGIRSRRHEDDWDYASAGSFLSSRTTAMPSSFGIIMSRRTRSGNSSRTSLKPSSPSLAVFTT